MIETQKSYKPFFSIYASSKFKELRCCFRETKKSIHLMKIYINLTVSLTCFSDSFDSKVIKYFPLTLFSEGSFSKRVVVIKGP